MDQKRDLFVSYHTDSSKQMVEKIVSILESRGVSCWYAPRDCENAWAEVILKAIDNASIFLVIINEHSMNSEHVKNEINAAFSRYSKNQLAIVIFKSDTSKLNSDTEYYLGRIHMVNGVEPPTEERIAELANRIVYTKEYKFDKKEISEESRFKSATVTPALCFVGRGKEIEELESAFDTYKKVFVTGMGGVGKSELVRAFLVKNKHKFRSIMYATYTSSIKDLIINDASVGISNFFRNPPDESDESYFARKMEFIRSNATSEDILVIDNFDTVEDEHLEALMSLPLPVIFTSRYTHEDYYNLKLDVIKDEDELLKIFQRFYPRSLTPEDRVYVNQIFQLVGNHTLTITIVANMMKKQRISPKDMVARLESQVQYGIQTQQDINNMISSIFTMSNITEEQQRVLQNMTLVPISGMSAESFFEYCKLDSYEEIDDLIAHNLILHDSARDYVSLHPIIMRTVMKQLPYSDDVCRNYVQSMIDMLLNAKYIEYTRRESVMEMIEQVMRILPQTSELYVAFYLACSKAYHAFAKHNMTVDKISVLNRDGIPLEARVEAMTDIADAFRCMEISDKLLEWANEAMRLCDMLDQSLTTTKKLKSELIGRFGWYNHLIGDHEESFRRFYEQLQLVLVTEGETDERIGWAYFNVALAKNRCKDPEGAIEYFERALRQFEKIEMDFAIANTANSISECYYMLGEYDKAEERLLYALQLFKNLIGDMHNDTARTKQLLAKIYLKKGDVERANQLHSEAIDCITKLGYDEIAKHWNEEFSESGDFAKIP